jgi:hypothetical protein
MYWKPRFWMLSAMCALVHLVFDKTTQGICVCSQAKLFFCRSCRGLSDSEVVKPVESRGARFHLYFVQHGSS